MMENCELSQRQELDPFQKHREETGEKDLRFMLITVRTLCLTLQAAPFSKTYQA